MADFVKSESLEASDDCSQSSWTSGEFVRIIRTNRMRKLSSDKSSDGSSSSMNSFINDGEISE